MSRHTPGPWFSKKKSAGLMTDILAPSAFEPGFIVAHVPTEQNNKRQHEEDLANVRLIVASPELLNACHSAMTFLLQSFNDPSESPNPLEQTPYDKLEAAVAKAEGRKP